MLKYIHKKVELFKWTGLPPRSLLSYKPTVDFQSQSLPNVLVSASPLAIAESKLLKKAV